MTDTRPIAAGETAPGCKKRDPIVVAENVTRSFGGINAVDVDYLEIPRHKITALIGPNGAGKTTLFNLLTGFRHSEHRQMAVRRTKHRRRFLLQGGADGHGPHLPAHQGHGQADGDGKHAARRLQTSPANGCPRHSSRASGAAGKRKSPTQANVLLEKFKLDAKKDDYAASLSGGQRKLLEMARSLMVRPKLVMLDEPMAGVNPALTQSLLDHIKNLKAEGMTVLFVEHDMHMVRHIADWVVVMAEGKMVAEGPPGEVMKNPAVIDAYLGAHHDVDLGDSEGIKELAAELVADEESIVGTENAGIISLDVVAPEAGPWNAGQQADRRQPHGSRRTDQARTDKDSQ